MTGSKKYVVIVGGSLAGLIHGVVLKRMGYDVRILERSASSIPENQGAGLAAAADLQKFMSEYDATKRPYGVPSPDFQMVNAEGKVVKKMGIAQLFSSWEAVYYRLRANFDGLKSDYCKDIPTKDGKEGNVEYLYGSNVVDVREVGQQVAIHFKDMTGTAKTLAVDLVIAADGPSSTIRQLLEPSVQRKYAGYCGWRGILPEEQVSKEAMGVFGDLVTFCKVERSYLISYTIPGKSGELEPGSRMRNWVWYWMYPENSDDLKDLMTDKENKQHRITLPVGKIRDDVWEHQKKIAKEVLDPYSAELVMKTTQPFVQALTDVVPAKATFLNGKVLLVGDALATFRPTTGQSTNQAARNAMDMREMLEGKMTLEEWEMKSLEYAIATQKIGVERAKAFGLKE